MIDRSLMQRVLASLECVADSGVREDILANEIALDAARHIEASAIREHLSDAKRRGWAHDFKGLLGETRWKITEAGSVALRAL